jgi:hypothetical protein
MKRFFYGLLTCLLLVQVGYAKVSKDEGMWLPMLISRYNHASMQQKGFKLSADEVYSVNQGSMKDAIISLGGFCTGELISNEGLMLTNHHCAFSSIQFHSSVEKDYLTNGFWAYSKKEELPCPEVYASILVRMEDVTERVLSAESKDKVLKEIADEASKDNGYTAVVKEMFNGNQYILFVSEKFLDVRLVGAPPSDIGKFGGDTDNWMWPRHTGDFSLFRVYANKDGKPAAYSEDNVPLTPKYFFPVSAKGVKQGDFAMVFGYPGRTDRYLVADGLEFAMNNYNPALIKALGKHLEIMKRDMDADDAVRIKMADTYASLANGHKYYIGQSNGLRKSDVISYVRKDNEAFSAWVNEDETRKEKYGKILTDLNTAYNNQKAMQDVLIFTNAGIGRIGTVGLAITLSRVKGMLEAQPEAAAGMLSKIQGSLDDQYKDYVAATDQKLLAAQLLLFYNEVPKANHLKVIQDILKKYKAKTPAESFEKFAADAFKKSGIVSKDKMAKMLEKPTAKSLGSDILIAFGEQLSSEFGAKYGMAFKGINVAKTESYKLYLQALMERQPDRNFYPDANSTLRMTYGTVQPYEPRDAVSYDYVTYADGILEKMDNTSEEFKVPAKLEKLLRDKDYGNYAEDGKLVVCFLTDNDITGGNSGSPVINGNGEIIGCAFDGNWESMTGDLVFDPALKRTICVDMRYVLFIIDKFAGAQNLIDEMKIVR